MKKQWSPLDWLVVIIYLAVLATFATLITYGSLQMSIKVATYAGGKVEYVTVPLLSPTNGKTDDHPGRKQSAARTWSGSRQEVDVTKQRVA